MKKKDWVGLKFDMLTVLEDLGNSRVLCRCDCGFTGKVLHKRNFSSSNKKSCGCDRRKSEVGNTYNYLTITEDYVGKKAGQKLCRATCRCGRKIETRTVYITTGDIKSCGCMQSKSLTHLKSGVFKEINEETLYWAGFIGADGCISGTKLIIRLKESDINHLEKIKGWLKAETKITASKNTSSVVFSIGNKEITKDLLDWGIWPRKSANYSPVGHCVDSLDFWRGMIDGDGCISKDGKSIGLCGTRDTCDLFRRFVKTFCKSEATVRKHSNIFTIRYGGPYAIEVMQKLYGNNPKFYLDRKYELANKFCNFAIADDSGIN